MIHIKKKRNEKRQLWVRPIEWLKVNFASCVIHQTRDFRGKKNAVDTRSYPLDRTASLSLWSFKAILAPRGHSETILVADPRDRGYITQPTWVCLHTSHLTKRSTYLLRDNPPTHERSINPKDVYHETYHADPASTARFAVFVRRCWRS